MSTKDRIIIEAKLIEAISRAGSECLDDSVEFRMHAGATGGKELFKARWECHRRNDLQTDYPSCTLSY